MKLISFQDGGGLQREFYDLVGKYIKDSSNGLFELKQEYYALNFEIKESQRNLGYMNLLGTVTFNLN